MLHKAIKGFEDYLITNTGRVYSLKTNKYLTFHKIKTGYLEVRLRKQNKTIYKRVHRLVAEAFIKNSGYKMEVDHINRNKLDNRVDNLRFVSSYENCENTDYSKYKPIVKKFNDEISLGYISIRSARGIKTSALRSHIIKGKRHFKCKGREFYIAKEDL